MIISNVPSVGNYFETYSDNLKLEHDSEMATVINDIIASDKAIIDSYEEKIQKANERFDQDQKSINKVKDKYANLKKIIIKIYIISWMMLTRKY